jgi:transcriptional regulator with XRE-family HTH domain
MTVEDAVRNAGFAIALRNAIVQRGLSLSQLRMRLRDSGNPVSMATLSYWRSGERHPEGAASLSAVDELERILGLRPRALSELIVRPARVGAVRAPRIPFDDERERREIAETFAALGAARQETLRDLSTHMAVVFAEAGAIESSTYRCLIQVTSGSLTELSLIDVDEAQTSANLQITDVVGARLDREHRHPGGRVSGIVIAFDRRVEAGETVLFEFTEVTPPDYPRRRRAWHATARSAKETLSAVRFPPGREPDWCEEYVESEEGEEESSSPVMLRGGLAHAVRHGFGPGVLGVRWGYLDDPAGGTAQTA